MSGHNGRIIWRFAMNRPAVPSATTVFDSILFRDAFGTPRMREIFSDYALIGRCAEVEIALARRGARCGGTPGEGAQQLATHPRLLELNLTLSPHETGRALSSLLPPHHH